MAPCNAPENVKKALRSCVKNFPIDFSLPWGLKTNSEIILRRYLGAFGGMLWRSHLHCPKNSERLMYCITKRYGLSFNTPKKFTVMQVCTIHSPACICLLKVNNRNTRRNWCCSGIFIVNFDHISHLVLLFLLLTLNM